MINNLYLVLLCVNLGVSLIGVVSLILAIIAYVKVMAMEKSTHSIQYVTPDELKEWSTNEKEIEKINKINRDDVDFDFSNLSI